MLYLFSFSAEAFNLREWDEEEEILMSNLSTIDMDDLMNDGECVRDDNG